MNRHTLRSLLAATLVLAFGTAAALPCPPTGAERIVASAPEVAPAASAAHGRDGHAHASGRFALTPEELERYGCSEARRRLDAAEDGVELAENAPAPRSARDRSAGSEERAIALSAPCPCGCGERATSSSATKLGWVVAARAPAASPALPIAKATPRERAASPAAAQQRDKIPI